MRGDEVGEATGFPWQATENPGPAETLSHEYGSQAMWAFFFPSKIPRWGGAELRGGGLCSLNGAC